ncbi:MAG: hypothetical protein OQJ93_12345 [Ignavibacteriaceae bacterium]|nr:hypothetical protein [Ignavibacteriaceae bacterium]
MSTKAIIRVFLFNIFLIICLSFGIYGQDKPLNLIWIYDFQDMLGHPDDLATKGVVYLYWPLRTKCLNLCKKKVLSIEYEGSYAKKAELDEVNKRIKNNLGIKVPNSKINNNESAIECMINTTYRRDSNYYYINSAIEKGNDIEIIPTFKLSYKLNKDKSPLIIYDSLTTHAVSIAACLYKIYDLWYYIYPQPMKLPDSLSSYRDISNKILTKVVLETYGLKVTLDSTKKDANLIVQLKAYAYRDSVFMSMEAIIKDSTNQPLALSEKSFYRDNQKNYEQKLEEI